MAYSLHDRHFFAFFVSLPNNTQSHSQNRHGQLFGNKRRQSDASKMKYSDYACPNILCCANGTVVWNESISKQN